MFIYIYRERERQRDRETKVRWLAYARFVAPFTLATKLCPLFVDDIVLAF